MKQVTARTPQQVREWVSSHAHHIGYVEGTHPNYTHLVLQGHAHRLRIPTEVHKQCSLKPSVRDRSRMFIWDARNGRKSVARGAVARSV